MKVKASSAGQRVHYAIREVSVLADKLKKEGRDVIFLNIGDPGVYGFEMASEAREAVIGALKSGKSAYAPSIALEEAREAIRRDAESKGFKRIVDIFTGNGVSELIDLSLTALCDPGDNVLLPSPVYPLYVSTLAKLGIEARFYRLDESCGWDVDVDSLPSLIDEKTRAIVLINPNNPTGTVISRQKLERIAEIAIEHELLIMSDEIYDALILDEGEDFAHMAAMRDDMCVLTFNGLSKNYLAPGLRVGWGILTGPGDSCDAYAENIRRLLRARLCASHPAQYAVAACLGGEKRHLAPTIETLRRRRDLCMRRVAEIEGLSCQCPQGAFYAFIRLEREVDASEWCRKLLEATGVVVVPGSGFYYKEEGCTHFRMVFLPDETLIDKAFDRIAAFMKS